MTAHRVQILKATEQVGGAVLEWKCMDCDEWEPGMSFFAVARSGMEHGVLWGDNEPLGG